MKPTVALLAAIAVAAAAQAATPRSPKPATPPPIIDCFGPGPWIVFFDANSAVLRDESKPILRKMIDSQRGICGGFDIVIQGHIDRGEASAIALQRAHAVRAYLLKRGFKAAKLTLADLGATRPRVEGTPGAAQLQNRRVEIHEAPPPARPADGG